MFNKKEFAWVIIAIIIPIADNPLPLEFKIKKSSRTNKKFKFETYQILYSPGDEEYFLLEQLFWKGKIRN